MKGIYWGGDFEMVTQLIKKNEIDLAKIRFFIGYSGWIRPSVDCRVGWNDFHFLAIFENWHIAIDWLYFYALNSKTSANFAACKIFIFKKHRDLENKYFF